MTSKDTKISRKARMVDMNIELNDLIAEMSHIRNQAKKKPPCEIFFAKDISMLEREIKACRETDLWSQKVACRERVISKKIDLIKNIAVFVTKQKITSGREV